MLPRFYGKAAKDLDEFLFEFEILCRSYDYTTNAQKLKHFHSTLKDNAFTLVHEPRRGNCHYLGLDETGVPGETLGILQHQG